MNITAPTISLKQAAAAAGLSARWLRDALAHGRLTLMGQVARQAGGWNKGAPVDVFRLLVVRKLLECGCTLDEAAHVMGCGVDPHLMGLCGCGIDLPVSFLLERLRGHVMYLDRDDDTGVTISFDLGHLAADAMRRLEVSHTSTAAETHDRSIGGRAGAAAGAPTPSTKSAGTPLATES